jgi:myo-inositol-1(or 4)-monophosphatase
MSYSEKVIPIIREAGKELKKYFGNAGVVRQKKKSPAEVVTELDLKTEKYIAESLKKIYPAIDFCGEEFGGDKNSEKFWLLDPIDGTAHFIRGIPFCTTMLALIESGEVIFSVIHDFIRGDTYHAEKDKGAKMNNQPIHVSQRRLADAYIAFEMKLEKNNNSDLFISLRKECVLFATISCGYEFALVAQGKIEGRITLDPYGNDYDYAPGSLLVSEAGGVAKNIGKDSYNFKNHDFIAANQIVYGELKNLFGL